MRNKKRAILSILIVSFQLIMCRVAEEPLVVHLTTPEAFDSFINHKDTINVVKFYASWCRHSKNIEQPYRELVQTYQEKKAHIRFGEADVDILVTTRKAHGVNRTPYFLMFKNGNKFYETTSLTALKEKVSLVTKQTSNK